MRTILVPIDFSEVTERVVDTATSLAQAFSSKLCLLHVAAPDPAFVGWDPGPDVVRHQRATDLRDEHRRAQDLAEELRGRGLEAQALLVQGPTVETILERAAKLEADLIVLGSHGHGALYRALLGSISEGVVRKATCPVLIVPARGDVET
jgi:nucleotide-binding universal stress UspA family protein